MTTNNRIIPGFLCCQVPPVSCTDDLTVATEVKFQRVSLNKINAGRQLSMCAAGRQVCMCIHRSSFKNVDMNMLSALSDQGRQTYRSEIVQAASGGLLPATVRPAPLYTALSDSLSQTGGAYV